MTSLLLFVRHQLISVCERVKKVENCIMIALLVSRYLPWCFLTLSEKCPVVHPVGHPPTRRKHFK